MEEIKPVVASKKASLQSVLRIVLVTAVVCVIVAVVIFFAQQKNKAAPMPTIEVANTEQAPVVPPFPATPAEQTMFPEEAMFPEQVSDAEDKPEPALVQEQENVVKAEQIVVPAESSPSVVTAAPTPEPVVPVKPVVPEPKPSPGPSPETIKETVTQTVVQSAAQVSNPHTAVKASPSVKPVKHISVQQQFNSDYQKALSFLQKGHTAQAAQKLQALLEEQPNNINVRQTLISCQLETKQYAAANDTLQQGLAQHPEHSVFRTTLARLLLEQGQTQQALDTLQAGASNQNPSYQAFYATVLQQQGQHNEALNHYLTALQQQPTNAKWLVGTAISLEAEGRAQDAKAAYQRAIGTGDLDSNLQRFAQGKLQALAY